MFEYQHTNHETLSGRDKCVLPCQLDKMDKIEQPCFAPKSVMTNYDPEYIKFGFLMSSSDAELKVTFHFVLFAWEDGPPPSTLTWLELCGTDEKLASTFSPNVWKKANKHMFQNGKTTQRKPGESCTEGWEFVCV